MQPPVSGEFADSVRRVVAAIPPGRLASYSQVAARAGHPGAARAVGSALTGALPWWRVVRADGVLARGAQQAKLLAAESVEIVEGRVRDPRLRASLRGGNFDAP